MKTGPSPDQNQAVIYEIRLQGTISGRWGAYFGDMHITVEEGTDRPPITTAVVDVADQAALLGILQKLHNLGYPLLQVTRQTNLQSSPHAPAQIVGRAPAN